MVARQTTFQTNLSLTAGGSEVLPGLGESSVVLVINVTGVPVGGGATLQYTMQEVDPGDHATLYGAPVLTAAIVATGVYTATLPHIDGAVKVSWTVVGTWSGVYSTLLLNDVAGGGTALVSDVAAEASLSSIDGKFPAAAVPADATTNATSMSAIRSWLMGFNGTTWDRLRTALLTPSTTLTGMLNMLPWAVFNATPTTRTEGQGGPLQASSAGSLSTQEALAPQAEDNVNAVLAGVLKPLTTNTYAPSLFTNFAANATLNVKASAGNVFALYCRNANAAVQYIQLHNTATVPGGGGVPLLTFPVPPATGGVPGLVIFGNDFFGPNGIYFATGVAFAWSTTEFTYTAATAGDQSTSVIFK